MTDPFTIISGTLGGIKTAIDITKYIRESQAVLSEAEFKLKLADLLDQLAEAKISMTDIRAALEEKDKRIKELEEALQIQGDVVRIGSCYYMKNDAGKAIGAPFCSRCYEIDHKLVHVVHFRDRRGRMMKCPACDTQYNPHATRDGSE